MVHGLDKEAKRLAQELIAHDRWFRELDPSAKDEFSEQNNKAVLAEMGLDLAEAVLRG